MFITPRRLTPTGSLPWAFVFLLLIGCTDGAHIYPPAHPVDPVTVYLTDYGRHSTLLLPVTTSRLVEYEWGDWNWLALNERRWYSAPVAMLFSTCSTFSRRFVEIKTPSSRAVKAALDEGPTLIAFEVERPAADELRRELDDRFLRDAIVMVYNSADGFCMARDPAHYSIFHNCNHLTADWLRALGCTVEGGTMTSKFKLMNIAQPAPIAH